VSYQVRYYLFTNEFNYVVVETSIFQITNSYITIVIMFRLFSFIMLSHYIFFVVIIKIHELHHKVECLKITIIKSHENYICV